jgi:3-phosphoshikimate 1-carboxyvinyltransferase
MTSTPTRAVTVVPARRIGGRLSVPGDKSISHRYAILASLAEGSSVISNYAPGADCQSTLACLRQLGVDIAATSPHTVTILGRGIGRLRSPVASLDAGNSGTTMRLLAGVLAGHTFDSTLAGDASLSRRPMRRVIEPLERMGARIEATDGHPPLTIHGARLAPIAHVPKVPSAQVKSAVLFAGLHAEGLTTVTESVLTRDHTERGLEAFGASLERNGLTVGVTGGQRMTGRTLAVPGDFSSAAYWMVAAAALPGSRVQIDGVGLNPTRIALVDVLRRFGARVDVQADASVAGEPRGSIVVECARQGSLEITPEEVPGLIDELPAVAALGAHGGEVRITGATELRVKESDRISALVAGFRALGIAAEELPDGLVVGGSGMHRPDPVGAADAQGDHRMAMAFAVAALGRPAASKIDGADAVAISYPDFFATLERLVS